MVEDLLTDSLKQMTVSNLLCHRKCSMVHAVLNAARVTGEHLTNYEDVPKLADDTSGLMKPFCFRLCVKPATPLFLTHNVKEVSVSIPMDAMGNRHIDSISTAKLPSTIEIMLFDADGKGNGSTHPLMDGSDISQFTNVARLLLFLDKLAVDERPPVTEGSHVSDEDDELRDLDE